MTTRDIVVAGALPRHQVRQLLKAMKLDWTTATRVNDPAGEETLRVFDATEAQWGQIQEWVKKVTG